MEKVFAEKNGNRYRDMSLSYAYGTLIGKRPKKKKRQAKKTKAVKQVSVKLTAEDRLKYLLKMSKIKSKGKVSPKKLAQLRFFFAKNKYRLLPLTDETLCYCCGNLATIRHHKILLNHGGTNDKNNLVPLCEHCHMAIHPWMDFINPIDNELDKQLAMYTKLKQTTEKQDGQEYIPERIAAVDAYKNSVLNQLREAVNLI